jgi:hypothetical protein
MPDVEYQYGEYPVAALVKVYFDRMLKQSPNLATPMTWMGVLEDLDKLTTEIEGKQAARVAADPSFGTDQLSKDIERWRARLDWYTLATHAATDPLDRNQVLWDVTAPLMMGWHGGPKGTDVLAPGGYPPGFNVQAAHGADISTPYSLANQMGVWMKFCTTGGDECIHPLDRLAKAANRALQAAGDFVDKTGKGLLPEPPLGIPWWAWGVGAITGVWVLR